MPINALIAQGIRPIGADMIAAQGAVNDWTAQKNRNALADREMVNREAALATEQSRYAKEDQRLGEQDQERRTATDAQRHYLSAKFIANSPDPIAALQQFPEYMQAAQQNGIDLTSLTPDVARQMAQRNMEKWGPIAGIAPEAQPVPFEQSDEYKKLVLQGTQARELAAAKHNYDMALKEQEARLRPPANGGRPAAPNLPVPALKIIDDATQAIGTADESMGRINEALALIDSGTVDLGLLNNAGAVVANTLGRPDDSTKAYAKVKQILEKLRNNYLLLSKGVQTEGDAKRAWNSEVGESALNSNAMAKQSLENARTATQKLVEVHKSRINNVNSNFGITPAAPQGWSVEEMK